MDTWASLARTEVNDRSPEWFSIRDNNRVEDGMEVCYKTFTDFQVQYYGKVALEVMGNFGAREMQGNNPTEVLVFYPVTWKEGPDNTWIARSARQWTREG